MWLSPAAVTRIRELELALRESVPREVYQASLARIAELERREAATLAEHARQLRWYGSMLLRRAGSMALPPTPEEKAEAQQHVEPPAVSETQIAQAEAIVEEGYRVNASREEIEKAVRESVPGITEDVIAEALRRDKRL
jgi:hypothetical protein